MLTATTRFTFENSKYGIFVNDIRLNPYDFCHICRAKTGYTVCAHTDKDMVARVSLKYFLTSLHEFDYVARFLVDNWDGRAASNERK